MQLNLERHVDFSSLGITFHLGMRRITSLASLAKYFSATFILCTLLVATSCKRTDKNFSLDFIDSLSSIELSQDSLTVVLTKNGNGWTVNNTFDAGFEQIDMLLYIVNTQHIASQIPDEQATGASNILANEGITIRAFEGKKAVLDITVATSDSLGYFGRSEDNKELYRLSLPDIVDNPFGFLSANPSFWKHNAIITALPSEIDMVTIDNLEDPEKSFRITRDSDGSLSLFDVYNGEDVANINQEKLNTYLSYFTGLAYEQILQIDPTEHQAILLSDSPYKLTIGINGSELLALQLFYITEDENLDAFGNALKYDPNQLYLSINDGRDIALAKWVNFDLLLRDLAYFVEN